MTLPPSLARNASPRKPCRVIGFFKCRCTSPPCHTRYPALIRGRSRTLPTRPTDQAVRGHTRSPALTPPTRRGQPGRLTTTSHSRSPAVADGDSRPRALCRPLVTSATRQPSIARLPPPAAICGARVTSPRLHPRTEKSPGLPGKPRAQGEADGPFGPVACPSRGVQPLAHPLLRPPPFPAHLFPLKSRAALRGLWSPRGRGGAPQRPFHSPPGDGRLADRLVGRERELSPKI